MGARRLSANAEGVYRQSWLSARRLGAACS